MENTIINKNSFLFFSPINGLDGSKVAVLKDNSEQLQEDIARWETTGKRLEENKNLNELNT